MKAEKLTIRQVFDTTERKETPLFQRPYVWQQEDNWEPLWESIRDLAERRLLKAESPLPHFMGALVLDQIRTQISHIHTRLIIDGQQRLTTLQLAICAARDLCISLSQNDFAQAFRVLTENQMPLSIDKNEIFKVWPTNADREDFCAVMRAATFENVKKLPHASSSSTFLIPKAYVYFYTEFKKWIEEGEISNLKYRLHALYGSIVEDLCLVVIDLDSNDNSQGIFETLNSLGTPLLPADLVKNYLFRVAESQKLIVENLYKDYWEGFENEDGRSFWRAEARQGRLKKPRLNFFLWHYLVLKKSVVINYEDIFRTFKKLVEEKANVSAEQYLIELRASAKIYRSFSDYPLTSREGVFIHRLQELDNSTVFPVLLQVFHYHAESSKEQLLKILIDIESFLIRRLVCELTPKNYNRRFVEMISLLNSKDWSSDSIRAFLLSHSVDDFRWPDDTEFRKAWLKLEFYKRVKRSRICMILEALEVALHNECTEKISLTSKLTIEHLLPVTWKDNWPLLESADSPEKQMEARQNRNEILHRIGNLTLLTQPLNSKVSNGPWDNKKKTILKHSALNLNRALEDIWNEQAIEKRSEELYEIAKKIWPYPPKT